jgi:hypothetical protein
MIARRAEYKLRTVGWHAGRHIENHLSDRYVNGEYKLTRREKKALRQSREAKNER